MRANRIGTVAIAAALVTGVVWAQGRNIGGEWPTAQGDAQRTSWVRSDPNISVDALSKPGFELQWKTQLENGGRPMPVSVQGVTVNGVTLFTPLSIIAGNANNIVAIDNDTGATFWSRSLGAATTPSAGCPATVPAAATRMATLVQPPPTAPRAGGGGGGRGGYSSSVGQPGEGVPAPPPRAGGGGRGAAAPGAAGPAGGPPGAGAPAAAGAGVAVPAVPPAGAQESAGPGPAGARGGRGAANPNAPAAAGAAAARGGGGGFGRPSGVVYVIASDGTLHSVGLPSAKDIQKPAAFLPAGARWTDPLAVNDILYTSTKGDCGGAPNAVWAIDLSSDAKPVVSWKTNGGSPVGNVALATDGTVIAAIGPAPTGRAGASSANGYSNAIVALDPKTLQVKHWYTDPNAQFVSGPVVFRHDDKDIVAAATKDGRILLLDAASLGGANHSTPLFASRSFTAAGATFAPDALAFWQQYTAPPADAAAPAVAPAAAGAPGGFGGGAPAGPPMIGGAKWLVIPINGRVATDGQFPAANGTITNGAIVAFKIAADGGRLSVEPAWVSHNLESPAAPLVVNGVVFTVSVGTPQATDTPTVLYALNGTTGNELWNSGRTIGGLTSGLGVWTSNSQVYVGTNDGLVYAFGFPLERK